MAEDLASYLVLHVQDIYTITTQPILCFYQSGTIRNFKFSRAEALLYCVEVYLYLCLPWGLLYISIMQASTEQKQRYLREQIIESNYDPEQFIQFLNSDLKIQQLDVQQMQMQTLQSVVLKFKQYKYYLNENQSPTPSSGQPNKRKKIEYEKYSGTVIFDYQFEDNIKCVQIEPYSKSLEVYVPNIQIVEKAGIFFSKTEVWFVVKTNLAKHPIKRLEEDFQWLSNAIAKLYPLLAIPELVQVAKENEGNHQKRRKQLEEFMQIVAGRDQMRQSTMFFEFLTFPPEKMEKMKKNYDSMSFVRSIHSLKNQSGLLSISLTSKLRNYALSTQAFIRKIPKLHNDIFQSLQRVTQSLDATSKQIYKIVDCFAELHELYSQITNKSPQYKINQYSEVLININNLYHSIANDLVNKSQTIQNSLKEYYKIQVNYDKSMYKVFRDLYSTEKEYLVGKGNLNRKKERLYPDVTRWEVDEKKLQNKRFTQEQAFELMLPRETKLINEQKQWLAYLYCNFRDQFKAFLNYESKRYSDVYCTFCSELLLNNKTYIEQLTKFIEQTKKLSSS